MAMREFQQLLARRQGSGAPLGVLEAQKEALDVDSAVGLGRMADKGKSFRLGRESADEVAGPRLPEFVASHGRDLSWELSRLAIEPVLQPQANQGLVGDVAPRSLDFERLDHVEW